MSEITVADPIHETNTTRALTTSTSTSHDTSPEPFDSERVPVTLGTDIRSFLRVANRVEPHDPRIAYLCRVHAFEMAHIKDTYSTGRGVRQFKTALLQRLEQDEVTTIAKRKEKSDLGELRRVHRHYKNIIDQRSDSWDLENREVTNAREIAPVLYEVLQRFTNAACPQGLAETDIFVPYNILPLDHQGNQQEIMRLPEIKAALTALRNIRGLPVMQDLQKPGAAVDLFDCLQCWFGFQEGNVANQREHLILLLANTHIRQASKETFELKLGDGAVDELMKKFFKNYTNWCKFLGRKRNIRLPYVKQDAQQYKILYIGLYLLIWGEAANLRFMPECLCYIFHHVSVLSNPILHLQGASVLFAGCKELQHARALLKHNLMFYESSDSHRAEFFCQFDGKWLMMAYELHGMLTGAVSSTTWEKVLPAYGGQPESFLNNEAEKNKSGMADHSTWRNYDDLNEYFWSPDCFQIGWPMRLDHDFFCMHPSDNSKGIKSRGTVEAKEEREGHEDEEMGLKSEGNEDEDTGVTMEEVREQKWLGKTNFVETRSFWQIFRSFDRMWSFFILSLQALIIMACHDMESPFQMFDAIVFEDVMSIFITSAILKVLQAILDIAFTWKARHTMDFYQRLKYVLKLVVAMIWTIVLPVCYADSRRKHTCHSTEYGSWPGEWCISSYMVAVAFYLMTNAVEMVLFLVPTVSKYIEISNFQLCMILSWWTQEKATSGGLEPCVGNMDTLGPFLADQSQVVSDFLFRYCLTLCYIVTVLGVVEGPTRQIMKIGVKEYDWHELFPKVKSNAGAIVAIWSPIILVFFMDTQIWYSVFCTIFGGVYGILHHLGEIRTLGTLRSRFHSLPSAFNVCLIPSSLRNDQARKGRAFFPKKFQKESETEKNSVAKFVQVWNQIIASFRLEDLINNRELDLMTIPLTPELFSGLVRWPVFLLANKFSTALNMARDFEGKDEYLFRKIRKDHHMYCAVKECYESLKLILETLVVGDKEKRIVFGILNAVEESIERLSLLEDFQMSELPTLHAKCIELVELLVEGNKHHYGKVVKVLQDIFEVVTHDMMTDSSRILDLLYSSEQIEGDTMHISGFPEPQLFASNHGQQSIKFPFPDNASLHKQVRF
ncbi:putative callose synthase 8 [Vitis vinifera]|nr:putative callose synthase 8 [Vitis vinifera]